MCRIALALSVLILVGCKESGSSLAAKAPALTCTVVDELATDIYETPTDELLIDSLDQPVGYCIAVQGHYAWVTDAIDSSYHYAISLVDGTLRESVGLVFSDAGCTAPIGEVFDYPLHLSGDVYLFQFEGTLYEYPIGIDPWVDPGAYFIKAPGGSCNPFTAGTEEVRVVQPSAFARAFSGTVGL